MKKLSLLLALAMFGFGSATIVNAEMEETSDVPASEDVVLEADTDGDGIVSEEEQAAYDEAITPAE